MREVESEAVRRHKTTLLLHMLAQYLTQAVMNDMRSRVVAHDGLTALSIYGGGYRFSVLDSRQFLHDMHRQSVLTLGIHNRKS